MIRLVYAQANTRCSLAEPLSSGSLCILVPNTGIQMQRLAGAMRPEMAPEVLRIRACYETWMGVATNSADQSCQICGATDPT
eukprot:6153632-Lingulodinium_polyedra.AAC.1